MNNGAIEYVMEEPEALESGWDINAIEYLRQALKPDSVWSPKDPTGMTLIIDRS